jgi:hypothetical protein
MTIDHLTPNKDLPPRYTPFASSRAREIPSPAQAKPKPELTRSLKLYNKLTTPNATDSSATAKAKTLTRKVGEKLDEALKVSLPRNTEQYRKDERRARAMNDPKDTVSFREQLRGGLRVRGEEEGKKARGKNDLGKE